MGNLILCASSLGFVDLSVINGDIIVKDGELQTFGSQGTARLLSPETAMHVLVLSLVSNVHLLFVKIAKHDLYTSYLEFVFCTSTSILLWCL